MSKFATVLAACGLLVLVGCGGDDGPKVYKVTGKLTVNGQAPSEDIAMMFHPENKENVMGSAVFESDGTFRVVSGTKGADGLQPGTYKVYLAQSAAPEMTAPTDGGGKAKNEAPQEKITFPEAWASPETTPKSVEIKAETNDLGTIDVK